MSHLIVTVIQQLRQSKIKRRLEPRATALVLLLRLHFSKHVYDADAEDWVEHVATALTSSDSMLGKQNATYVLPLIRQVSRTLTKLSAKEEADERSGKIIERQVKERRRRKRNASSARRWRRTVSWRGCRGCIPAEA